MPLLSYAAITNYPFQPFTKILSADTVLMFSTIQTWANGNIDSSNVKAHGLTRYTSSSALAAGTANYVVYNDANGDLTEAAQLPPKQGGLGFDATPAGATDANKVPAVNAAGTGFALVPVPSTPGGNIFNYYNFS